MRKALPMVMFFHPPLDPEAAFHERVQLPYSKKVSPGPGAIGSTEARMLVTANAT